MNEFKINKKLCEFYGILIGDGCISKFNSYNRIHHAIRIDGNSITDYDYYLQNVKPLLESITKRKIRIKYRKYGNCIFIMFEYKELALFLKDHLTFPFGKKGEIKINEIIVKDMNYLIPTLRGIFDTDGSLYFTKNNSDNRYYPIIELCTHSKALLNQLYLLFTELNFNVKMSHFQDSLKFHGKENLIKFMRLIGSNHPDKLSKFRFWKKFGHCPKIDELNYKQRLEALNEPVAQSGLER